jgi:ribosomal protein S27AE
MPRSRKINLKKVLASLNTMCPKCGFTIAPDQVKRVDFERMECPKCGEKFKVQVTAHPSRPAEPWLG